jgi:hypothetical protein
MEERRKEPRIDVNAAAVLTPLAAVAAQMNGHVINVSSHGVKVRVVQLMSGQPRIGDVYRILSGRDDMLCEVSHSRSEQQDTEIGFRILHWSDTGELNRVARTQKRSGSMQTGSPGRSFGLRVPPIKVYIRPDFSKWTLAAMLGRKPSVGGK